MDYQSLTQTISMIGFPAFVCLIQIYINAKILKEVKDSLLELNTSISVLINEVGDLRKDIKI